MLATTGKKPMTDLEAALAVEMKMGLMCKLSGASLGYGHEPPILGRP